MIAKIKTGYQDGKDLKLHFEEIEFDYLDVQANYTKDKKIETIFLLYKNGRQIGYYNINQLSEIK